jgi:hypothetical protein
VGPSNDPHPREENIMLIRDRIVAGLAAAATAGALLAAGSVSAQAAPAAAASTARTVCCMRSGLEAGLHGSSAYRSVRGHAEFRSWGRRHLEVSLWNARHLAGRTLVVYVHGTRAGTMHIGRGGSGHFNRSRGVPRCSAGTVILIRTQSGTRVASGTFHRHWMM